MSIFKPYTKDQRELEKARKVAKRCFAEAKKQEGEKWEKQLQVTIDTTKHPFSSLADLLLGKESK